MKKTIALTLALVMLVSFIAGCGSKPAETQTETPAQSSSTETKTEAPKEEAPQEVKYKEWVWTAYTSDLDTADPYGSTSAQHQFYTNMTFNVLTKNNPDTGELDPELATSWEDVNGDGVDWKINLVKGAKFHNGNDFTADDVKFTWEYAAAGANNVVKPISAAAYINSMEVVDENTIIFHLNTAMFDFPTYLEQPIYSKTAFDSMDPAEAAVIGTGPYYYDKENTKSGIQYVATRFDDYWGGSENYPTLHVGIKALPDWDTVVAAMEAGELDFIFSFGAAYYNTLSSHSELQMLSRKGAQSYYLGFNYKGKTVDWNNVDLRRAICQAINKSDVEAVAFNNGIGGVASYNFCAPSGLGYKEVDAIEYDPDAAKEFFSANYPDLKITLIHYSGVCVQIAEVIQANLKAVGVDCQTQQVDGTNWASFKAAGEGYDMFLDYCAYQGALLYNFNRFFYTNGSSNVFGFYNAEYEKLQDNVQNAPSYEAMLSEFGILEDWVAANVPVFPIAYNNMMAATVPGVEGLVLAPTSNYMNFSTIYIVE